MSHQTLVCRDPIDSASPMPTVNLPGWGVDKTTGQHGVVALLGFEKLPVPTALLKELRGGN